MSAHEITAVSIAVQIDGKAYFVNLPLERMQMVVVLATSLTDGGKLKVIPAPAGFQFAPIGSFA